MTSIGRAVLTMIMAGGRGERLYPLTRDVAKPAVTFGGCYRIIDITLSNCFNSGFRRLYLLTQYSNLTLNRHLKRAWYPVIRDDDDEFLEELPPQHRSSDDWYHGTADSVFQNICVLQKHRPENVLVLSGDHVYKMDYVEMLRSHLDRRAELTVAAVEADLARARDCGVIEVNDENRVLRFVEKPRDPPSLPGKPGTSLVSMGIYIFKTAGLVRGLIRDAKDANSKHDFAQNLIPSMVARGHRVYVYSFRDPESGLPRYWRDIGTLDSYFTCNLELVEPRTRIDLYDPQWPIHTHVGSHGPARIVDSVTDAEVKGEVSQSLVSLGCCISGGRVERSVLSPGVRVHAGALVSECILMDEVDVGRGAAIRQTIVCPGVRVPDGVRVGFDPDADRRRFTITERGIIVIPGEYAW